jgi:regulator of RNase E activity RraA
MEAPKMSSTLTAENRVKLRHISAATITTALFKRGLRNQAIQGIHPLNANAARMVGEAYTLRYIPAREDLDHIKVFEGRSHPQRVAIEECPEGHVMVIDSRKDPRAASAGGILITRLMMRKAAGIVSDGGFRDTPDISKLDFPVYCMRGSAPTNLILHHATDINVPIGCGDAPVYPGDIVVGDGEAVVIIPAGIANEIAEECYDMTIFEDWVESQVKTGRSIFGLYPPDETTRAEFQAYKAQHFPKK